MLKVWAYIYSQGSLTVGNRWQQTCLQDLLQQLCLATYVLWLVERTLKGDAFVPFCAVGISGAPGVGQVLNAILAQFARVSALV